MESFRAGNLLVSSDWMHKTHTSCKVSLLAVVCLPISDNYSQPVDARRIGFWIDQLEKSLHFYSASSYIDGFWFQFLCTTVEISD